MLWQVLATAAISNRKVISPLQVIAITSNIGAVSNTEYLLP